MIREWKEAVVVGLGLGKITWKHVHEDGTEHETEFIPPDGSYFGLIGEIPAGSTITCLSCGKTVNG